MNSNPSSTTCLDRHSKSNPFIPRNLSRESRPYSMPSPCKFFEKPRWTRVGSDQIKSTSGPSVISSVSRSMLYISFRVASSGPIPPLTQNILRSITAAQANTFPEIFVGFLKALVVEAVQFMHIWNLMASLKQKEGVRILDFIQQQQHDGFQRLLPIINIISQEKVRHFGRPTPKLKQLKQPIKMPMDTADNLDGSQQIQEGWLISDYFLGVFEVLGQLGVIYGLGVSSAQLEELFY